MGRDLVKSEHGWAVFETVSSVYWRESRWCKTKAEIMKALINQGIPIFIVEMFDKHNHLPSILMSENQMFSTIQITTALAEAGLNAIDGEPMECLYPDAEEE